MISKLRTSAKLLQVSRTDLNDLKVKLSKKCHENVEGGGGGGGIKSKISNMGCNILHKVTSIPGGQQLAVGSAAGFVTGILTKRVGKVAAFSVGGTILLISAAEQTGLVGINWDKFKKKTGEIASKAKMNEKIPGIKCMGSPPVNNKMLVVGFVGGFLIGIAM